MGPRLIGLQWRPEDQVDRDAPYRRAAGCGDGGHDLLRAMTASQRFQHRPVEALSPERDPVEPDLAQLAGPCLREVLGVGLEGDLGPGPDTVMVLKRRQDAAEHRWRHMTGGASTEVDRIE